MYKLMSGRGKRETSRSSGTFTEEAAFNGQARESERERERAVAELVNKFKEANDIEREGREEART